MHRQCVDECRDYASSKAEQPRESETVVQATGAAPPAAVEVIETIEPPGESLLDQAVRLLQ
eukprot:7229813-Pyramimonas_sp.AAC.1